LDELQKKAHELQRNLEEVTKQANKYKESLCLTKSKSDDLSRELKTKLEKVEKDKLTAEEKVNVLGNELQKITKEYSAAKESCEEITHKLDLSQSELKKSKDMYKHLIEEKLSLEQKLLVLNKEKAELDDILNKSRSEMAEQGQKSNELVKELKSKLQSLNDKKEELERTVNDMLFKLDTGKADNDELLEQLEEVTNKQEKLELLSAQQNEQLQRNKEKIQELEKEKEQCMVQIDKYVKLEKEWSKNKSEMDCSLENIKLQVKEGVEKIGVLQSEKEELISSNISLKNTNEKLNDEVAKLKTELGWLKEKSENLSCQLEKSLICIKSEKDQLNLELKNLGEKFEKSLEENNNLKKNLSDLEQKREQFTQDIKKLRSENESLIAEKTEQSKTNTSISVKLEQTVDELNDVKGALKNETEKSQQRCNALLEQIKGIEAEKANLKADLQQALFKIEMTDENIAGLNCQLQDESNKKQQLTQSLQIMTEHKDNLVKKNGELVKEMEQLQKDLDTQISSLDSLKKIHDEKSNENSNLSGLVKKFEEQIAQLKQEKHELTSTAEQQEAEINNHQRGGNK
jgi:chromosome segregation ATPase